jgi:hypothetical protein
MVAQVKDKQLVSKGTFDTIVAEARRVTLKLKKNAVAGEVNQHDVVAALGGSTEAAKYNLDLTEVQVLVKETDAGSPMYDMYYPAKATQLSYGFTEAGLIRVENISGGTLPIMVRVIVHKKPPVA